MDLVGSSGSEKKKPGRSRAGVSRQISKDYFRRNSGGRKFKRSRVLVGPRFTLALRYWNLASVEVTDAGSGSLELAVWAGPATYREPHAAHGWPIARSVDNVVFGTLGIESVRAS